MSKKKTIEEKIETRRKWLESNKERLKEQAKHYRDSNKEKVKQMCKSSYLKNKDYYLVKGKAYYKANKEQHRLSVKRRRQERKLTDPLYKLETSIRRTIWQAFKRGQYKKTSRTFEILGCTYISFKLHIESLWEPWMNWDNYGKYNGEFNYGWDIDHIIELSSATSEADIIKLNHYSNLRPLCSKVNRYIKPYGK